MGNLWSWLFPNITESSNIIPLPSMGADPDTVVFTGYSCGSWMSNQMHVIHSSTIKGVGLFNGGVSFGGYENATAAQERVNTLDAAGSIDPVSNVANSPVYIFGGANDNIE